MIIYSESEFFRSSHILNIALGACKTINDKTTIAVGIWAFKFMDGIRTMRFNTYYLVQVKYHK